MGIARYSACMCRFVLQELRGHPYGSRESLIPAISTTSILSSASPLTRVRATRVGYRELSSIGPTRGRLARSSVMEASLTPCEEHMKLKKVLRAKIKASLASLTTEQKRLDSGHISKKILEELEIIDSLSTTSGICMYLSCDRLNEVDASLVLERAFERNLRVYLPRVLDKDSNMHFLRVHPTDTYDIAPPFGIREPTLMDGEKYREDALDLGSGLIDVIFMPGLGFGRSGGRLGRGGGYYDAFIDRYTTEKGKRPLLVGLAFDEQMVDDEAVPMDAHDHYCDVVVSPTHIYRRGVS
jgi:5-formyltetrahydrofolate cyclo-ligase